jgi:hypothetical protein
MPGQSGRALPVQLRQDLTQSGPRLRPPIAMQQFDAGERAQHSGLPLKNGWYGGLVLGTFPPHQRTYAAAAWPGSRGTPVRTS